MLGPVGSRRGPVRSCVLRLEGRVDQRDRSVRRTRDDADLDVL